MKFVSSKFAIAQALFNRSTPLPLQISKDKSAFLWVSSVQREDGSGHSFNITGQMVDLNGKAIGEPRPYYITTTD